MKNLRNFAHKSNSIFYTNMFGQETSYYIQSHNLPGVNFSHINTSKNSAYLNFQGDTLNFNSLSLSLILDEEFKVWKEFMKNIFKMREQYSGTGNLNISDSWLEVQDDNSNIILKVFFKNCILESVGDIEFNSTQDSDDEIITLDISIIYDYYTIE